MKAANQQAPLNEQEREKAKLTESTLARQGFLAEDAATLATALFNPLLRETGESPNFYKIIHGGAKDKETAARRAQALDDVYRMHGQFPAGKEAHFNTQDYLGYTPETMAAVMGTPTAIYGLREDGAGVSRPLNEAADMHGNRPQHHLAMHGTPEGIRAYAEIGGRFHGQNINGDTPSHLLVQRVQDSQHFSRPEALMDAYASVANIDNVPNHQGRYPSHELARNPQANASAWDGFQKAGGVITNQADTLGNTEAYYAVQHASRSTLQALAEAGMDFSSRAPNTEGKTIMGLAIERGEGGIVQALVDRGVYPSQAEQETASPQLRGAFVPSAQKPQYPGYRWSGASPGRTPEYAGSTEPHGNNGHPPRGRSR